MAVAGGTRESTDIDEARGLQTTAAQASWLLAEDGAESLGSGSFEHGSSGPKETSMELARNGVIAKPQESRHFVPSVVQPLELSRRQDSSAVADRSNKTKGQDSEKRPVATEEPKLACIDEKRVDEAAAWISAKVASTLRKGAEDVGEYVMDTFFSNDPDLARSRNPHKNASYRGLAEKCGTPELPISKTWLHNAVGIALMLRRLPQTASAFRALPPSYQETLLPLGDPEEVERIAKQAANSDLTCRELRQVVAEHKEKKSRKDRRGRPATPSILRKINRSVKAMSLDENKHWFSKDDIQELNTEQRKAAFLSVQKLIENLKDLVIKLKNT